MSLAPAAPLRQSSAILALLAQLKQQCATLPQPVRAVVAYSGGLDSTVLLWGLAQLHADMPDLEVRAVHVHHGLSTQADAWAAHCEQQCAAWQLPYTRVQVVVPEQSGQGLEAAARQVRYAALVAALHAGESLWLAHHQDDQAETLLLQLLRGAGVKGLAAMPVLRWQAKQAWVRPMLPLSRADLHAVATQAGLTWVEDDSQTDLRFARNYLRQHIVPQLRSRWPQVTAQLARSAAHCAEADQLLTTLAEATLTQVAGQVPGTLSARAVLNLMPALQRCVLRYWWQTWGQRLPSAECLHSLITTVFAAQADAQPVWRLDDWLCCRFRDAVYAMPQAQFDAALPAQLAWSNFPAPLQLPMDLGVLHGVQCTGSGLDLVRLQADFGAAVQCWTVRARQGGERLRIGQQHVTLKHWLQAHNLPPWQRQQLPLLYAGNRLIAVITPVQTWLEPVYCVQAKDSMGWLPELVLA